MLCEICELCVGVLFIEYVSLCGNSGNVSTYLEHLKFGNPSAISKDRHAIYNFISLVVLTSNCFSRNTLSILRYSWSLRVILGLGHRFYLLKSLMNLKEITISSRYHLNQKVCVEHKLPIRNVITGELSSEEIEDTPIYRF